MCRAITAQRLAKDLEVNAPGVAIALDLLGQIDALRKRLSRYADGVNRSDGATWPEKP
ncbi:chaperone modulator CbpM [Caballeronia fortuita]|uniref:chaperone modulator CbpM n=1 Tax=Caballeronia fortuita TaxID=1777138 RepID=UPI0035B5415A